MEQLNAFMQIVVERGIIYAVGVIVIWRSVKQVLGKKNGGAVDGSDYSDKMKGYAKSAVEGQAALCGQSFTEINRRLESGDKKMDDMIEAQSSNHGNVMRAIGQLEGAVKKTNGAA